MPSPSIDTNTLFCPFGLASAPSSAIRSAVSVAGPADVVGVAWFVEEGALVVVAPVVEAAAPAFGVVDSTGRAEVTARPLVVEVMTGSANVMFVSDVEVLDVTRTGEVVTRTVEVATTTVEVAPTAVDDGGG